MLPAQDRLHAASRYVAFLMLTFSLLVSAASASKKDVEASGLIEQAKKSSDIRAEGAPPFRLRLNFKIIKEDGSVGMGRTTKYGVPKRSGVARQRLVGFGGLRLRRARNYGVSTATLRCRTIYATSSLSLTQWAGYK